MIQLGEFISPSVYELEVAINESYTNLLAVGKKVELFNIDKTNSWTGTVSRVNARVNPSSQTVQVFIQVKGKDLREGMYLEAEIRAKEEVNTFEINRKLIFDNDKIFVVKDSILETKMINPVFFKEKTVIVKGLEDGIVVLSKPVPGAYPGMKVAIYSDGK